MLSPSDLLFQLLDSVQMSTRDTALLAGPNPYLLRFGDADITVLIKNVSGTARGSEDECRIQVGDSAVVRDRVTANPAVLLGYDEDTDTFTAWDPEVQAPRFGLGRESGNVSLYSRRSALDEARRRGAAVYVDTDGQRVLSFQPDLLAGYLENRAVLHQAADPVALLLALDEAASESDQETISLERESVTVTLTRTGYPRDPKFRRDVLNADGDACVVCGMQMGLLEAAHIVPHAHPAAPIGAENGMTMCPLHHAAFDAGILVLGDDFTFKLNPDRVEYFAARGRAGGLASLRDVEGMVLRRETSMPTADIVRLARSARGL